MHIIAIKKRKISVVFSFFLPLSASGRRLPERFRAAPPVSGCRAVKGCRDCVGSRAPQLAFSRLSACLSAEMTDGRGLRADGGPQRAPSQSVTDKRRRRRKNAPLQKRVQQRMIAVLFAFWSKFHFTKPANPSESPSFTSFACSVSSQTRKRSKRVSVFAVGCKQRANWAVSLDLFHCSSAI